MKTTQSLALMFALGTAAIGSGGLAIAGEPATAAKADGIVKTFPFPILHFSKIITGPRSVAFDLSDNTFLAFTNNAIWGMGPSIPQPGMYVWSGDVAVQAISVGFSPADLKSHLYFATADGWIRDSAYLAPGSPSSVTQMVQINAAAYGPIQSIAAFTDSTMRQQHVAVMTHASGGSFVWDVVQGSATLIANTVDSIDGPAVDIAAEDVSGLGENMVQIAFANHFRQFTWPDFLPTRFNNVTETLPGDPSPWMTKLSAASIGQPIVSFSANERLEIGQTPIIGAWVNAGTQLVTLTAAANGSDVVVTGSFRVTPTSVYAYSQNALDDTPYPYRRVVALSDGEVWEADSVDGLGWVETLLGTFQTPF